MLHGMDSLAKAHVLTGCEPGNVRKVIAYEFAISSNGLMRDAASFETKSADKNTTMCPNAPTIHWPSPSDTRSTGTIVVKLQRSINARRPSTRLQNDLESPAHGIEYGGC